jgi:hypothetical protein
MIITIFIIIEILFSAALFIGTHLVEKLSNDDEKPTRPAKLRGTSGIRGGI